MKKYFLLLITVFFIFCSGCSKSGSGAEVMSGERNDSSADVLIDPNPIPETASRTVTCHMCHGDGVCFHCDGDAFRNGRRCSVCDGTGYCNTCGGVGSLEVLEINGKDYTICTTCHGEGICGLCEGTGRIVHQFSTLGRVDNECSLCHGSGNCLGCKGTGLRELRGF